MNRRRKINKTINKNKVGICIFSIIIGVVSMLFFISPNLNAGPNDVVFIADEILKKEINKKLGFSEDHNVTESEILNLKQVGDYEGNNRSFSKETALKGVKSLEGLQYAKNLSDLLLVESNINDFSMLENLPLKKVQIDNSNLEKIPEFPSSLLELRLNENKIGKIENLENLTRLTRLYLEKNQIVKIESLENNTNLDTLSLENNKISKIEGLDKLNLDSLYLSDNQIKKIEGLDSQANLGILYLDTNQISKIENLENNTQLDTLSLYENQISKIEGLESLSQLTDLELDSNKISKIEGLDNNTSLSYLSLEENKISKIEGLENLSELTSLSLADNQISKIEGLDNNTSLSYLYLGKNKISKIEGLEKLSELTDLGLEKNQLSNIEYLKDFDNLSNLDVTSQVINLTINSKEFDFTIKEKNDEIEPTIVDEFKNNITKIGKNRYKVDNNALKKLKNKKEIFEWKVEKFSGKVYAITEIKEKDFFEEKIEKNKQVKVGENLDITTLLLNKPEDAKVEKVEDINTNTLGLKKGKIKVTFNDGSFKEIEVEVFVNAFDININYTNKNNEIIKSEVKTATINKETSKIEPDIMLENFDKELEIEKKKYNAKYEIIGDKKLSINTDEYLNKDLTKEKIQKEVKVKATLKIGNVEDDEKYRTHYKVTLDYKDKAQNVVKTEEVYVKKGEKLKLQDFEKNNKKYIIRNNDDREKEITKNIKLEIPVIEQIKAIDLVEPMASSIKITADEVEIETGDETDTKDKIHVKDEDKDKISKIEPLEKGDRSKIGDTKDKYKVSFKDGSSKVVEVIVKVNKAKVNVNYKNKKDDIVKSEKTIIKVGEKFVPEDFTKEDQTLGTITYVAIDKTPIEIKDNVTLDIKVKAIISGKAIEDDEKYRTHYKVTIDYKNKAQNVVKTEEVYVKKGEKLKLQDFEKDNKKYIIRNNEDREKEITKNIKLEIPVIEQIKAIDLSESMASSTKITTNEVKIKKEDNTTDTKTGIVILEKDKKNVKEIVLISKGERKNLAKVKDKYKVVFVDGSSKAVEVIVNINSMDAGIIDGSKAKTTHYKVSVEYVDTKGKVIKTEEKLVKKGEKLELTGFKEKDKNYVISKSSSIEILKSGKIQVEVKESVKIGVIEEINGKDIQTQKVSIISGEDYDTKKAIKIPDALKEKIKNIELVSKLDRTKLAKGYDEYKVTFKDLSSRKVKVEVEILEKKKDIKLNPIEPNKVNTNRDKKNNRKIKKLPFSGSITNNALYASILLAIVGIIYRRKLTNMKIKRTFRLKK